jgi:hypothetical protein
MAESANSTGTPAIPPAPISLTKKGMAYVAAVSRVDMNTTAAKGVARISAPNRFDIDTVEEELHGLTANVNAFPAGGCPAGVAPQAWRKALAAKVETHLGIVTALLALLDDGLDPDLEPTLGAPESRPSAGWGWSRIADETCSQIHWADGLGGDHEREVENEHGGEEEGSAWAEKIDQTTLQVTP